MKRWHNPHKSLHAFVDEVEEPYRVPLQQLLTAYQASRYGAEVVDMLPIYEEIQEIIVRPYNRPKRMYYFLRGWL
ncbi:hypothetical protein [Kurthia senegalensis]|nr:hypothetical protein [Kurthia senegalensis]